MSLLEKLMYKRASSRTGNAQGDFGDCQIENNYTAQKTNLSFLESAAVASSS
jgi:hypothetical protein